MPKKTLIITGGHHNSALVVAQELKRKGFQVVWFGHRYAARGDQQDSAEYQEVTEAGIPFHELKAGKLSSPPRISEVLNIPFGTLRAISLLIRIRPVAVLSFGGYLGLTTAIAGFLLHLPVYLHEQTIVGGKANLLTSRFAKKAYLTWNSSLRYFPAKKSMVVGLPLRKSLLHILPRKQFSNNRPTLLVMGGKQGSHVINEVIFKALRKLTKNYNVIHQTGTSTVTGDYSRALALKNVHYQPQGYLSEDLIGKYYAAADLVISRSGAHTAYELAILGKRAILIPFMQTTGQEQLRQAELLRSAGLATIIPESELTVAKLLTEIKSMLKRPLPIPLSLPQDASTRLVENLSLGLS